MVENNENNNKKVKTKSEDVRIEMKVFSFFIKINTNEINTHKIAGF